MVKTGKKCFCWFIRTASFSGDSELKRHPFWKDAAMFEIQGSHGRNPLGQVYNANRVTNFIEIALSDKVRFFPKEVMLFLVITSTFQV